MYQKMVVLRHGRRFQKLVWSPWDNVMILKIFAPKKIAKILAFLTQNKAKL
jgi:hypothetical protein